VVSALHGITHILYSITLATQPANTLVYNTYSDCELQGEQHQPSPTILITDHLHYGSHAGGQQPLCRAIGYTEA
jgi:hypothetical protein